MAPAPVHVMGAARSALDPVLGGAYTLGVMGTPLPLAAPRLEDADGIRSIVSACGQAMIRSDFIVFEIGNVKPVS